MAAKIMIVDDSPFSRTLLADVLRDGGYEVVGEADCLEAAVSTYQQAKPDIVTMDIAMPQHDGFEISTRLLHDDPNVKIILSSSIKDDDAVLEAKRLGISGYVQKPIDPPTLYRVIEKVLAPDSLYTELSSKCIDILKEALSQDFTRMTKLPLNFENNFIMNTSYASQGITAVIGIIGQYAGTMIVDMPRETAQKLTEQILHHPPQGSRQTLEMVSEFTNIIAGSTCSMLNKTERSFGFRVAPPSIFEGDFVELVSPGIQMQHCVATSEYGQILISIGFKRGTTLWM